MRTGRRLTGTSVRWARHVRAAFLGEFLGNSGNHGKAGKTVSGKAQRLGTGTAAPARGARAAGPTGGRRAAQAAGDRRGTTGAGSGSHRGAERPAAPLKLDAEGLMVMRTGWREAIERIVTSLHYDLVDVERAARGLLRVYIDRQPDHRYPVDSDFVTVEDCELVTRQLQYALEVEGVDYARLEVSSPGVDRPLKREADYLRFEGHAVSITLKEPFEGRKVFKGVLGRAQATAEAPAGAHEQADQAPPGTAVGTAPAGAWTLTFTAGKTEQVLGFGLEEVREARLVPVLDFKGRRGAAANDVPAAGDTADDGPAPSEGGAGVIGG